MPFDLTNKNIKDTFQNLLQKTGSDGHLYDLVGNKVRDLTIDGTLTANTYITSESIVNTSSGSTAFGNSSDDTHKFIGHITASGNISASGDIFADNYYLEGSKILGGGPGNNWVFGDSNFITNIGGESIIFGNAPTKIQGHITASGNISSSGNVYGERLFVEDLALAKSGDTISLGSNGLQTTNRLITNHITASGNISSSGTLISNEIDVASNITASGNISASNMVIGSIIQASGRFGFVSDTLRMAQSSTANNLRVYTVNMNTNPTLLYMVVVLVFK
mgnify:CR=1 FL=1